MSLAAPRLTALLAAGLVLAAVEAGPQPGAAGPLRLEVDPSASEVSFLMHTTWHDVEGRSSKLTGSVTSAGGDLFADGLVRIEIAADSLATGNSRRDRTMRETHLETSKFPAISFASTGPPAAVSGVHLPDGSYDEVTFTVPGSLTVHGVARRSDLTVTARRRGAGWLMTGEAPVKLSEHGIADPSMFLNKVQDEVKVTFRVSLNPVH